MFSFMKKDKDKDKEKKEKKKKEKEEKHEKKEKREKKERQNITPEEMSRLEDVKRSVFHRLSDRDHYRKTHTSGQGTVGKSESSESNISAASGTESSSSGTQPSPSRELPPTGSGVSRSKSMPGQKDQEKARPQVLPKPRSILKAKSPAGGSGMNHDKLDDVKILQDNTRLNEEMSGMVDVTRSQSTQLQSSAMPPSATEKLEPVEEIHTEKSFEGKDLPLPPLVPSKPPRIRDVTVKRNVGSGFGFSLRKGTLPSTDGSGVRAVVFAEPGLGSTGSQTALLPGDRLVELNGKNVETWTREEIVELIKTVGDSMVLKVQPIPELIELSVRPGKDGSSVDMQEDVVKGGTLKRSGSMRYRKPVSALKKNVYFCSPHFWTQFVSIKIVIILTMRLVKQLKLKAKGHL